jgi:CBS domain-containing protein
MMGGALGGLEALFLPNEGVGFWPLVSMAAVLGGTMRAPLTSIIFAFELTHDSTILLPLLIASGVSYTFTVLVLKRSILTEKVARRGFHLSCEYAVDPLEILFVREVMRSKVAVLAATSTVGEMLQSLKTDHRQKQRLLPVVDGDGFLVGVISRGDIRERLEKEGDTLLRQPLGDLVQRNAVEAYPDEPLRSVVYRMAEKGFTRMPVVERTTGKFIGLVALDDLLQARARNLNEERRREQTLTLRFLLPGGHVTKETETPIER